VADLAVEAFRYHRWANLRLLDACARLSDAELQLTAAGTYGTIAATLQHLVGAEGRYLNRLEGGDGRVPDGPEFPGVARLRLDAGRSGEGLIEAAGRIDGETLIATRFGDEAVKVRARVILLQALHHGNDHRTHVCTILGSHGIAYEGLDVWAYGEATGALVPASPGA